MTLPLHELAALGTATCWATTGLLSSDAVRAFGAYHFNLIRQGLVAAILLIWVAAAGSWQVDAGATLGTLAISGLVGILLGDTFNFAAVGRIGPRRAGAVFALNAPFAALMGWAVLGEAPGMQAAFGIGLTAAGVAIAILGRPRADAHRFEAVTGTLLPGVLFGLAAAAGQAAGTLIARPIMLGGIDPYVASLVRVGASGLAMGVIAASPLAPRAPAAYPAKALVLTGLTAVIGLLLGMTLFLYALKGSQTGIIATLSATSPVIILPLLWLRTGQRPSGTSWIGAMLAVAGLALIFTR